MHMTPNYSFDLLNKKQILSFQLIAMAQARRKNYKSALKAIYSAQQIVSELDETVERNLDYLLSVNIISAYLLI